MLRPPAWLARGLPRAGVALALCGSVGAVALVRAPLAAQERKVKETSDVYALPGPEQVVRLSLGYRAALADYLWAHVLVSQGLHTQERRRFDNLLRFYDAINTLDPTFRTPYLFADALITFQSNETPHHEIVKAREIMELGVKNRPQDGEIYLVLGQFLSFISPSYLTDPAEKEQWKMDGARYLARAAELGGDNANRSWQALGGASILKRAGERDAAIRFLQRTLAVTDDDELKQNIQAQLDKLMGEEMLEAYKHRQRGFTELWARDLPYVNKTTMLVLGPPPDAAYCAGGAHSAEARCATTWKAWSDRQ